MARILFVDDDPGFLEEMKFLLEINGHEVVMAHDGSQAILLADQEKFDMVITDILMGKQNGMEVILHLRAFHPAVKIISITGGGWASPQLHLDSARMFGSDSCLAKPFPIESLLQEISRLLK